MTTLSQIQNKLPFTIKSEDYASYALVLLWLLTMILLPIARWLWGDSILATGTNIAALFQASAVFVILQKQWGLTRIIQSFLIIAALTWGAEFIGHRTGFPFGDYHYTELLQPQIAGVPLLIPIAWFMLLPSSWVMAQLIVGKRDSLLKHALFALVSGVALTAWDLFLDPQMVSWGFWEWNQSGAYFGIPLINYVGWVAVAALVTAMVRPKQLNIWPLALIYGIVWLLQTVGQAAFWGQIGPAIGGSLGMGSIMLLAYWRSQTNSK